MCLVTALCSLALSAQNIPPGDDVWDSLGGGSTDVTLTSADWLALCGASVPDTAVQLKGFNIPGLGTGDTSVERIDAANLPGIGSTARISIQLKALSLVNDGAHPCSPNTLRVKADSHQEKGTMTITKTSAAGGTFFATVPVNAVIEAVNSSGAVIGSTTVSGSLDDESASPWSYNPPSSGAPVAGPWYPGVDPVTKLPVRVCRIGKKILPARHCYRPRPKCKAISPVPVDTASAAAIEIGTDIDVIAVETCTLTAQTTTN
ncbi:MAG TPA: hypothetical protein DD490_09160 [Acidobacteria bacterium]|nr:hypothetical protein [Acidobacteriota bacterium]